MPTFVERSSRSGQTASAVQTPAKIRQLGPTRILYYESLAGVDTETLGIVANQDLFDRIQKRRAEGFQGAVTVDEYLDQRGDDTR